MSDESNDSNDHSGSTSEYFPDYTKDKYKSRDSFLLENITGDNDYPIEESANRPYSGVGAESAFTTYLQDKRYSDILSSYSEGDMEASMGKLGDLRSKPSIIHNSNNDSGSGPRSIYFSASSDNNSKSHNVSSDSSIDITTRAKKTSWGRSSTGTVSTSMLLNFEKSDSTADRSSSQNNSSGTPASPNSYKRTSSFYPPVTEENSTYNSKRMVKYIYDKSRNSVNSRSNASVNTGTLFVGNRDNHNPDIEDAVKQLQSEMGVENPTPNPFVNNPFSPTEYKIKKRVSITGTDSANSSIRSQRLRHGKSLIGDRLISDGCIESVNVQPSATIPALRSFSVSNAYNATPPIKFSNSQTELLSDSNDINTKQLQSRLQRTKKENTTQETNTNVLPVNESFTNRQSKINVNSTTNKDIPHKPETAFVGYNVEQFSDNQIDTLVSNMNNFRNMRFDRHDKYKGEEFGIPDQRISSSSISSFDSENAGFRDIYSIGRLFLLLLICIVLPPLFFMIYVGKRAGVSDYRLMRLIMNSKHRIGLLKGYVWDIDVAWIRTTSLVLGIIEICIVFAMIGVGFGVGTRNE
ncbi:hypothetical protein TPHA_0J00650 [Tetrapisispora phaffii CBS 4417]|uniref:Uncharacterized protein n=1 Tax=Tetrapisispora phaffii (strain ATCC 24235 / CBS 4417 / NBRC 1672 / NRRL Y-8282 / UCD 70-5) TaxID=1071381 RepID=G8BYE6_TETPH|nr:hypothetical protein TPHA_0J00650 [Tetrapisispora phaffii CBS 4417]CCE64888.1 hypothetical protein TPHA_0J00650 [Tetrapisispora phaffii CBS 4417]